MTGWNNYCISEIAKEVAMGPFGSNIKTDNFVDSGVPIIRGINLNKGRFNDEVFVYLTERKADDLIKSNAYPDDIIFTHRGTLGQVGIIPHSKYSRYVISQSQIKLTVDPNIASPLFVYYYFKSKYGQYELLKNSSQVGVPAIASPTKSLKEAKIILPDVTTQHQIADILISLDDKIELNLEINKTLEEMAMTIYKEWFVDFGPFREGEFVDSELGPIPKGWEVMKIRDITKLHYGKALREKDRMRGAVPVYGSSGVIGYHNNSIVDGPSLIIGRKGNVGSVYWENNNSFPIDTVYYINQVPLHSLIHLYFKFLTTDFIFRNSDSVVPGLNRKMAEDDPIIIPCRNVYSRFVDIVYPLFELRFSNLNENKKLIETRDYILPKLISGEVRVNAAEKKLKGVL